MASSKTTIPEIPDGFTLHTENNSHILLSSNEAFLNPVQEFNRDTSVACIRVWSEELHRTKKEKWLLTREKKNIKKKQNKRPKRELHVCLVQLCNPIIPPVETDVSADTSEALPQNTEAVSVSADQV